MSTSAGLMDNEERRREEVAIANLTY